MSDAPGWREGRSRAGLSLDRRYRKYSRYEALNA